MRHLTPHALFRGTRQAGFTVLELMVATAVFTIVLLVLTAGVLHFSKDYFSSITRSNTQVVARSIIDDISKAIRFGQTAATITTVSARTKQLCIDNVQYLYATGYEVASTSNLPQHQSKYGLVKRITAPGCPSPPDITSGGFSITGGTNDHELLTKHMRVSDLQVQSLGNNTYRIRVRVAYGDDDLLGVSGAPANWATISCRSGASSQFCAVSDLSTVVQQRVTR